MKPVMLRRRRARGDRVKVFIYGEINTPSQLADRMRFKI